MEDNDNFLELPEWGTGTRLYKGDNDNYLQLPSWEETPTLEEMKAMKDGPAFLQEDKWFSEDISNGWLDFTEPYKQPRWTLSYKGKMFANLGELHVITGKSGSGKTAFMSMIMAAILRGNYGSLKYELSNDIPSPVLLYIDTEQGKDDSIAIKNRVCTLAGLDYTKKQEQFWYLRQRDIETAEQRWRQILRAVYEVKPNILFIDGMLDIVKDYNSQEECQPIIRKVMKLATEYNASIWCVLHENPTFEKMVGTLGSVLERKVTEAFAIRKHKNEMGKIAKPNRPKIYFSVEQKKARRYDQDDWDFEIINNAEGWGVPQEIVDISVSGFSTRHTPDDIKKWIEECRYYVSWPTTRTNIYNSIFAKYGVTDDTEQKELMQMALNRRFLLEQSKSEMKPDQKNPRIKLNEELFSPF